MKFLTVSGWYLPALNKLIEFESLEAGKVTGKLTNADIDSNGKISLFVENSHGQKSWYTLPSIHTGVIVLN